MGSFDLNVVDKVSIYKFTQLIKMSSKIHCRAHPSAHLIEDHRAGDIICSDCGLVVGDRVIDVSSEWRTFASGEKTGADMCRVGGPENSLLGSSNLSTMIGPSPIKGGHSYFSSPKYTYASNQNVGVSEKALLSGFGNITNMCDRINLPDVIKQRTQELFKTVYEGRCLKGRANDAIASACLYIACRKEGVPRSFKEIVAIGSVNKKEIGRCFKLILKAHQTEVEVIQTGDFMHRFCSTLGLSKSTQKAATYVAKQAEHLNLAPGKSPLSIAAAAIYMATQASDIKKTGAEISEVAGVAATTIRQAYRILLPRAAELFPEDYEPSIPFEELPVN